MFKDTSPWSSRRRFLAVTGAIAVGTVVLSCQQSATTPPPPPTPPAAASTATATVPAPKPTAPSATATSVVQATPRSGAVKLTWWTTETAKSSQFNGLQTITASYSKASGNLVDLISVPWDAIRNKLVVASQAGQGPQVMGPVPHDWFGALAKEGMAAPLTTDALGEKSQYLPGALEAVTFAGQVYGFPLFVESIGLIRNKGLVPQAPDTWDALISLSKQLTQGGQWGFLMPVVYPYHSYGFITGYGGYVFKWTGGGYDTTDIGLASQGAVEGCQFIQDLYVKHKLFPAGILEPKNAGNITDGNFEAGKAAIIAEGPWVIPGAKKGKIDYGISLLPKLPNGQDMTPFSGIQALMVGKAAPHQTEAFALAAFATGKDSAVALWKAYAKVPVRRDTLALPELKRDDEVQTWSEQAARAVPMPNIPEMAAVWKPWGDALPVIIAGKSKIQPILETAVQQIKAGIAKMTG